MSEKKQLLQIVDMINDILGEFPEDKLSQLRKCNLDNKIQAAVKAAVKAAILEQEASGDLQFPETKYEPGSYIRQYLADINRDVGYHP
ncbi:MAG: hypothetical protein Q8Q23_05265 [bacterium]|nr:hypothetical protein [bacterium]